MHYILNNQKQYYKTVVIISSFITIGFLMVILISPHILWVWVLIFVVIETIYISSKFTKSIAINNEFVTIDYIQFFSKKKIELPTCETKLEVKKMATFRSHGFYVLIIRKNGKKVYEVDSRDGFKINDFEQILKLSF